MSGKVVQLVPKVKASGKGTISEKDLLANAFSALDLATETLKKYHDSGEARPNRVIVIMCSDLPDGDVRTEFITGNAGRLASIGLMETVKHDMLSSSQT